MPTAGPRGCAAPAGGRPSTAARAAVRARCARPSAARPRRRTPPPAGSTRGAGPLHRLRRALAGGGPVRALRMPVVSPLVALSRAAALPAAVHRRRAHHRRGPRHLRKLGQGGPVSRLRAARARPRMPSLSLVRTNNPLIGQVGPDRPRELSSQRACARVRRHGTRCARASRRGVYRRHRRLEQIDERNRAEEQRTATPGVDRRPPQSR